MSFLPRTPPVNKRMANLGLLVLVIAVRRLALEHVEPLLGALGHVAKLAAQNQSLRFGVQPLLDEKNA